MNSRITDRARILVSGLEDDSGPALAEVLKRQNRAVFTAPFHSVRQCLAEADRVSADVVFCPDDPRIYVPLLDEIRARHESLPVVVVSRTPEVGEWLNAIEAGAADYCAAPFEPSHISWILATALFQGDQYMRAAS